MVYYVRLSWRCFLWEGKYQKHPDHGIILKINFISVSFPNHLLSKENKHEPPEVVISVSLQLNSWWCSSHWIHPTEIEVVQTLTKRWKKKKKKNYWRTFLVVKNLINVIHGPKNRKSYRCNGWKKPEKSKLMMLTSFQENRYFYSLSLQSCSYYSWSVVSPTP